MIRTKNKGFSLIELVIVIAILAILTAVLAPALISQTEGARAGRDISAMDELTNAVLLSASDSAVYDELASNSIKDNVSCYIDSTYEKEETKVITKTDENGEALQYTYNDDARLADETPYHVAGKMRGVTITFEIDTTGKSHELRLDSGTVNKFSDHPLPLVYCENLYNSMRQTCGDSIELISQTYRNSEYTVFIKIGSTGGNQSSAQDAIEVYGQFSGTNLSSGTIEYPPALTMPSTEELADMLASAGQDIQDYLASEEGQQAVEELKNTLVETGKSVEDYLASPEGQQTVSEIKDEATEFAAAAKDYITENEDEIKDAVDNIVQEGQDWYNEHEDEIKDGVNDAINAGQDWVEENEDEIKDAIGNIGGWLGGLFGKK